ncbi:hypothetical protein CIHG_07119 [Coccidioides immitis H538.4]|uniref:Uncharacterized protein n=1 Tax=Coccidioides immitis H538.4 TaxID=396776 RepID=A0A0J8RVL0_COCIT|nr:hypothetical protein CIHG_07119 [Coccidioides immitis H538.4]
MPHRIGRRHSYFCYLVPSASSPGTRQTKGSQPPGSNRRQDSGRCAPTVNPLAKEIGTPVYAVSAHISMESFKLHGTYGRSGVGGAACIKPKLSNPLLLQVAFVRVVHTLASPPRSSLCRN